MTRSPPAPVAAEPAQAVSPTGRLVALGDSITVGAGNSMPGLPCRPWVSWLAQDLGLTLVNLAASGADARELLAEQLPRARGRYALACLYIGVNDVRGVDFDLAAFGAALRSAADDLAVRSDRLLIVTVPLDLGRPHAGVKVLEANRAIRRVAGASGATLLSNEAQRGWLHVLPDAVHLTALGQRALAQDALRALAADGVTAGSRVGGGGRDGPSPRARARPLGPAQTLRYALAGHLPAVCHDLRRRAREGTLWRAL